MSHFLQGINQNLTIAQFRTYFIMYEYYKYLFPEFAADLAPLGSYPKVKIVENKKEP